MKTFIILTALLSLTLSSSGDVAKQWVHALSGRHASVDEKARACQRLGEYGDESAVPVLASVLNDPVLNVYARTALERIPGPQSIAALRSALKTCDGTQLIGVIESLGTMGAIGTAKDLTTFVGHADNQISDAALRSLGRMGRKTQSIVLGYLRDPSAKVRASAATASLLAAEARGDSKIYDAILKAEVPRHSYLAAIRGAILSKRTLPFLLKHLRSKEKDVRDIAFLSVRSFHGEGLTEALHKELDVSNGADSVLVVYALRDRPNPDTAKVLIAKLGGANGELEIALIKALGQLGGTESAIALIALVEKEEAMDALVQMRGKGINHSIVASLKIEKNVTQRLSLISLLGDRHAKEGIGALLEQTHDSESKVRAAAFRALRPMVGLDQVSELIVLFKTSEKKTSSLALGALVNACRRSFPMEAAGDQILTELKTTSGLKQREPWIRILIDMGYDPALRIIYKDLKSSDPETVRSTIGWLARWPNSAPVDALFPLTGNPDYQVAALNSILALITTSKDMDERLAWLKQAQPLVRSPADKRKFVSLISQTFVLGSLELLKPYLQDLEIAEEAQAASARLIRNMKG
jgi:HEAT repeat protein